MKTWETGNFTSLLSKTIPLICSLISYKNKLTQFCWLFNRIIILSCVRCRLDFSYFFSEYLPPCVKSRFQNFGATEWAPKYSLTLFFFLFLRQSEILCSHSIINRFWSTRSEMIKQCKSLCYSEHFEIIFINCVKEMETIWWLLRWNNPTIN